MAYTPNIILRGSGGLIGLRIHPGYAVLATVAVIVAALIMFQSRRPTEPIPSTSANRDQSGSTKLGLRGVARVIDGDTIDIRGTRVRLNGIDAPETKQTCLADDQKYQCGLEATEALIQLIGSSAVECEQTGIDRNRRVIARCAVGSTDIGGWMVEHGWAVAYRRFSSAYVEQENRAREQRQGMWAGSFTVPEDFRRMKREGDIR